MSPSEPSAEELAQAATEADVWPLAQFLVQLPMPILEQLTTVLHCVGSMSADQKAAGGIYLSSTALHVLQDGVVDELPTAQLLVGMAEFLEISRRVTAVKEMADG